MAEQPDYSGSCMLALYPPADIAAALAIPGGLDPASLHVTVAYTGDAADVDIRALTAAAIDASRAVGPFTAQIAGAGRFTGGEKDVAVALIDAPELEDLRAAVRTAIENHGIDMPREHGYTAHLSRIYLGADEPDPGRVAPLDFLVGSLSVVHGTTRIDIPLAARTEARHPAPSIAEQAREAYAEGWARTGGPLTDRVKAGCIAAVELACEHPHDPAVLEATLRLGSLEGTWACIFERRDELMAKQTATLTEAWRDATARLDAASMVTQIRAIAGLAEASDPGALAKARQAAKDAALTLLAWLPASAAWQRLRDAMRAVLQSGRAEGVADAIAIAGQAVGELGMDFDLAFTDAYQALENLGSIWADADGWLGRMLGRAADDLGRGLGDLAAQGASYEEMLKAAGAILDGVDGDAVSFITDWALQTAMARGALDLYASENVDAVSWVTAGDSRVCFPAGTPVLTPCGPAPIEDLREASIVITPQGQLAVRWVGARAYSGGLTVLQVAGRTVAATDDHPFSTPLGWREIGQIKPGDLVHTLDDEYAEVTGVVHFVLGKPHDTPADARKLRVAAGIAVGGGVMPVVSVGLDCNPLVDESEVEGPAADSVFLLELDPDDFECHTDARLESCLAAEVPVARGRTELSMCGTRDVPEVNAAVPALKDHGRSAARLGAVVPVQAGGVRVDKALTAPLAVDVNRVRGLAGGRADVVAVCDGALDGEGLSADRALLSDPVGPAALITVAGAEGPVRIPADRVVLGVEGHATSAALALPEFHCRGVVAAPGAEPAVALGDLRVTHELLSAVGAFVLERQGETSADVYLGGISSLPVYDIEVEQAHVFYASGFLVHNCSTCEHNETDGPYAPSQFPDMPDHPRCRCVPSADIDLSRYAAYFA